MDPRYAVVILAGGECKRLYPLTSGGVVKALLPVGNRPLLSYPLRHLAEAGIRSATVVAVGEAVAGRISSYLQQHAAGGGVACKVLTVGDDCDTADALRAALAHLPPSAAGAVVYSGDLVCDAPLGAMLVSHQLGGALATVLAGPRRTSPSTETKPGKAPKGVDYLGLDPTRKLLLFAASHPDTLRDLKVPLAAAARHGAVDVRSDLTDHHLYIFSRAALDFLQSKPSLSSVKLDLIPALCRLALQRPTGVAAAPPPAAPPGGAAAAATGGGAAGGGAAAAGGTEEDGLPGSEYLRLVHGGRGGGGGGTAGQVAVYMAPGGAFCGRVNTLQAYGDINREVAAPDAVLHLTGAAPSRYDNVVAASATLGNKATVGPACIVGEQSVLGDKTSVKRSVIGANCKLGAGVKVINSVLMEGVSLGDGAHVQNSVLCAGAAVQDGAALKDCHVGPGFVVAAQADHRGETLAKS
ncbi:MAG: eukaryotic translation initiation factor 2B gamma [Monoraphidium minutum]|nr:MAG: eukaryotic translation initiation factor 2B gamma [Monoraphidium minutum]